MANSREVPVLLFTDGSALGNGSRHCRAAAAVWVADNDPLNWSGEVVQQPSNQTAELTAIRRALEIANEHLGNRDVKIVSDSDYAVKCLTVWCRTWEKNGWKTAKKQPVRHVELIRRCLELVERHGRVTFQHVNSHREQPTDASTTAYLLWYGNAQADRLARGHLCGNGSYEELEGGQHDRHS